MLASGLRLAPAARSSRRREVGDFRKDRVDEVHAERLALR